MTDLNPSIALMGPTAAGKTELALQLVERFPLEIISVDSALIYRGMDIGTAKPAPAILAQYPHHLVDIINPDQAYSAAQFCQDALQAIGMIRQRGKIPLLVGGTRLYFLSLLQGLSALPAAQPVLRERLQARLQAEGSAALHAELKQIDPLSATRINPNDPQRLLRALEIYQATGKTMSVLIAEQPPQAYTGNILKLALLTENRAALHQRIARRFAAMLTAGLIEEVTALCERYCLAEQMPAMRTVGYRQVWQYLAGEYDYPQLLERGIIATRQLAKRQFTWLRAESALQVMDIMNYDIEWVCQSVESFLLAQP